MKCRSLKVFDTVINYYLSGQGKPLLFIHGHRSDALRWKKVILFLSKRFKVYAPDLPGFGLSAELKKPATMKNYADYLNEFVRKLKLKNYVLFGGSMGGVIALKMIFQKPKIMPQKLILFGTPYDKKYWRLSSIDKIFIFVVKRTKVFIPLMEKLINNDFLFYHLLWLCFPKKARKKEIINYEIQQWRKMSAKIWFETMVDLLNVNFSQVKTKIDIPTTIISSQNDQYLNIKKTLAGLKKLCPKNKTILLPFKVHIPKGELKLENWQKLASLLEKI